MGGRGAGRAGAGHRRAEPGDLPRPDQVRARPLHRGRGRQRGPLRTGGRRQGRPGVRDRHAASATTSRACSRCSCTCSGRRTRRRSRACRRTISCLQLYQATAEAEADLSLRPASIFAEGGVGVARLSSNHPGDGSYGRLPHALAHRADRGRRRPASTTTRCRAISRSGCAAGYFWLRDISGSRDLTVDHYLRYTF